MSYFDKAKLEALIYAAASGDIKSVETLLASQGQEIPPDVRNLCAKVAAAGGYHDVEALLISASSFKNKKEDAEHARVS